MVLKYKKYGRETAVAVVSAAEWRSLEMLKAACLQATRNMKLQTMVLSPISYICFHKYLSYIFSYIQHSKPYQFYDKGK